MIASHSLSRLTNETSVFSWKVDFDHLNTLCQNNHAVQSSEKHLTELLARFDRAKATLPTSIRLALRANFSTLHDCCKQQNASSALLQLIQQLADHAHKLPESMTSMDNSRRETPAIVL